MSSRENGDRSTRTGFKARLVELVGVSELLTPETYRAVLAEAIGTFMLLFLGLSSAIGAELGLWITLGPTPVVMCFGFAVAVIAWCIGDISGGHINPAVTIACVACGLCSVARAVLYVAAQLVGATTASALLALLEPVGNESLITIGTFGCNKPLADLRYVVSDAQAIGIEAVLTGILVFAVFATVVGKPANTSSIAAHITIGFTVITCMFAGFSFTGGSLNPARSFGPAAIKGCWKSHYVYWIGPIVGAVVAGVLYKFVVGRKWERGSCKNSNGIPVRSDSEPHELTSFQKSP